MNLQDKIKIIAELQIKLNDATDIIAGLDWKEKHPPYLRAALVESIELMDHLGWKWWKNQEKAREQAIMEIVDIIHFLMSESLVESKLLVAPSDSEELFDLDNLVRYWVDVIEAQYSFEQTHEEVLQRVQKVAGRCADNDSYADGILGDLLPVAQYLGVDFDHLFKLYVGKNVLNKFRQDHGYKEGRYVKDWNGKEDNEVLTDMLSMTQNPETLYFSLENYYITQVLGDQG